MKYRNTRKFIR